MATSARNACVSDRRRRTLFRAELGEYRRVEGILLPGEMIWDGESAARRRATMETPSGSST